LENLREVPFPANAHKMPAAPQELRGTWVEDQLRNYAREADIKVLAASIDAAVKFSNDRGVPIFCGEFGVYMINSLQADRVRWYQTITRLLDERHIARTSWDYFGGFGVYKTARGGDFHSDLNTGVVKALGFTPPIQRPPEKLREGFFLYDDYALQGIALRHWGESLLDLYDSDAAAEGNYSVSWKNIGRYDSFFFEFNRPIDWQYLASSGYVLQFKARTEQPVEFDLRFLDSEDGARIPWRMRYTITETRLPPDGEWHTIRIPLLDMKEHGAWVNDPALPDGGTWHNPRGLFSWDAIVRLDVAAEERALPGCTIWFDAVQITR
jgi:endoglucanase